MAEQRRATIRDIARYCGMSKSAVAYIVNNSPHYKGTEKSRMLVMDAAKKLNYRPNYAARCLSSNRSEIICVLMPAAGSRFYDRMMLELQHCVWRAGYSCFFSFWGGTEFPKEDAIKPLLDRNVDGLICWPGCPNPLAFCRLDPGVVL